MEIIVTKQSDGYVFAADAFSVYESDYAVGLLLALRRFSPEDREHVVITKEWEQIAAEPRKRVVDWEDEGVSCTYSDLHSWKGKLIYIINSRYAVLWSDDESPQIADTEDGWYLERC